MKVVSRYASRKGDKEEKSDGERGREKGKGNRRYVKTNFFSKRVPEGGTRP